MHLNVDAALTCANGTQDPTSNDKTARRSLPYDDIFELASESMSFATVSATNAAISSDASRTRAKRMRMDEDVLDGNGADVEQRQDAMLAEDMLLFSRLPVVKRTLEKICQRQDIAPDLAAYKLDDTKMLDLLKAKTSRLSAQETFAASPTLSRLLAKEGVGDGEGISVEVQQGEYIMRSRQVSSTRCVQISNSSFPTFPNLQRLGQRLHLIF